MSLHKKIVGCWALIALLVLGAMTGTAAAQRRGGRVVVAPRVVVVGGGFYRPYFYDPFWFDPWYGFYGASYPWGPWGYQAYPYPPYGGYRIDSGASLRLEVKPKEAEVYVDGYYAGIVDDFDGTFQRLSVTPGEHDIEIFLDGYRAVHQKIYARPRKTLNVKYAMERLGPGEQPEARPQPPERQPRPQAGAPRRGDTQPPMPPEPPPGRAPTRRPPPPPPPPSSRGGSQTAGGGTISIRVQPGDAEVLIDGERWRGPEAQDRLVVDVPEGPHTIQISKSGYRTYVTEVQVRRGETVPLNVSLRSQDQP